MKKRLHNAPFFLHFISRKGKNTYKFVINKYLTGKILFFKTLNVACFCIFLLSGCWSRFLASLGIT